MVQGREAGHRMLAEAGPEGQDDGGSWGVAYTEADVWRGREDVRAHSARKRSTCDMKTSRWSWYTQWPASSTITVSWPARLARAR